MPKWNSVCFPFLNILSQVNNDGDITFGDSLDFCIPQAFPLSGVPIIAPFWADVDTSYGGAVYYRETTDYGMTSKAVNEIPSASSSGFFPSHVTIVTWLDVEYCCSSHDKVSKISCAFLCMYMCICVFGVFF